jgi:hypothetical protein
VKPAPEQPDPSRSTRSAVEEIAAAHTKPAPCSVEERAAWFIATTNPGDWGSPAYGLAKTLSGAMDTDVRAWLAERGGGESNDS